MFFGKGNGWEINSIIVDHRKLFHPGGSDLDPECINIAPDPFYNLKYIIMTTVNIYLTFNGNCEEAFNFYKSVFGGEFPYIGRFKDMPPGDDSMKMPPDQENRIMHVSLPISKETMLMGSDTGGEWGAGFTQGNNFSISITTGSKEEADRLFNGLSAGGKVMMPMSKTFWSEHFGMMADKFGINWMVSVEGKQ